MCEECSSDIVIVQLYSIQMSIYCVNTCIAEIIHLHIKFFLFINWTNTEKNNVVAIIVNYNTY